jgi:hypothetical protein
MNIPLFIQNLPIDQEMRARLVAATSSVTDPQQAMTIVIAAIDEEDSKLSAQAQALEADMKAIDDEYEAAATAAERSFEQGMAALEAEIEQINRDASAIA